MTGRAWSGDVVVLRPRKTLIAAWVGAVAVLGLFVLIAALLRTADTGVYFRLADQVSMVLLGLFIGGGVLLLARPRVRADATGIEVRNVAEYADDETQTLHNPTGPPGQGLEGMRRRLESVGGRLDVRRRDEDGEPTFTATAWLPVSGR